MEEVFQPLFDLLAQEKKDLTVLHKYYIQLPSQTLVLEKSDGALKGEYRYSSPDKGSDTSPATVTPEGKLDYLNTPEVPLDEKWLTPVLTQAFFNALPISGENTIAHAEYEHTIAYNASEQESDFLKQVKADYELSQNTKTRILLLKSKYETAEAKFYTLVILLEDSDKKVQITYEIGLPITKSE